MSKIVLGVFNDEVLASNSISHLQDLGYNPKNISVLMRNKEHVITSSDKGSKLTNATTQGATAGGVVGAIIGVLAATGAIPGLGLLLVGGPMIASLGLTATAATTVAGAATGVVAGGLLGALTGLGLSKDEAKIYENSIREGGILVVVPARSGEEQKIENTLKDFGANQTKIIKQGKVTLKEEMASPMMHMP